MPSGSSSDGAQDARRGAAGAAGRRRSASRGAARRRAQDGVDRRRRRSAGPAAEEGEREVQRLVGGPAARLRVGRRVAKGDERRAGRRRQLERDEEAQRAVAAASRRGGGRSRRPSSARRSRCIASVVVRSRTAARSPGSRTVRSISGAPSAPATHTQTVPTGFSGVPPSGPAMPVIPTPIDGAEPPRGARRPAPPPPPATRPRRAAISSAGTPAMRHLRLVRVHDHAAEHVGRRARPVGQPRRHQPARARLGRPPPSAPAARAAAPRRSRRSSTPSRENTRVAEPLDARRLHERVVPPRGRREDRRDLELAPPQAGRDLERTTTPRPRARAASARARTPARPTIRMIRCSSVAAHAPARPAPAGVPTAVLPHRLQLARRAGQHDTTGPPSTGTTSPGAVPTGSSTVAPRGTSACLRFAGPQRLVAHVAPAPAQRADDRPDPLLQRRVELHRDARRTRPRPRRSDRRRSARARPT